MYIIGKKHTSDGVPKLFFGKVTDNRGSEFHGYEENGTPHIEKKHFEITKSNLVLNLGEDPHPGTIHGFDVGHRLFKSMSHDFFGQVHFFYKPKKEVVKKLWEAFDESAKLIKKLTGLTSVSGVWEVVRPETKGKWAGWYMHSKKEDVPNRFSIKPEYSDEPNMTYIVMHEVGHYLHANHMTGTKLNAKWLRLFNTSIKLNNIDKAKSLELLKRLLAGENKPTEFKTELDEEDTNSYNWILRTIKANTSVSVKELDLLFEAEYHEDIERLWPQRTIAKKELSPIVSEYATTNFRELIAESFAMYALKRELPGNVSKMMEKSLSYAKATTKG